MFGLGFQELVLILIIALVIFGPRKLPEIGRAVGKAIGEFKHASEDIQKEFREAAEPKKETKEVVQAAPAEEATSVPKVESEPDQNQTA